MGGRWKEVSKSTQGHMAALITVFIWGTTFISTKLLLKSFSATEILFFRLALAFIVLSLISPRWIRFKSMKEELLFMAAGLCGVTAFFMLQNIALTYTLASNVGVLLSVSPFFTAILSYFFLKDEELHANFFIGFAVSIVGISLISFSGSYILKINPLGDVLTILAAVTWAIYSILLRKISDQPYTNLQITHRVVTYGLVFLLPMLIPFEFQLDLARFSSISNLANMLFLGIGASALAFVTWNYALSVLGAVKTSAYIYAVPVITVTASALLLQERITGVALAGVILILLGLYLSERKKSFLT